MRADRLVAALLILQARGRLTAAELATELEVSVKTARRDLEALAIAGIPVYSQAGKGGGWSLVGGARTDLSGLTAAEARTLFLVAGPSASVAPEVKAALRKLVQALPATFRADAEAAAAAVVVDPARWGARAAPAPPHLELLRRAVIDGVQVRLAYASRAGTDTEHTVHPLGVVEKRSTWYLVAVSRRSLRTYRVDRVRSVTVTDDPVVRPDGFDLAHAWRSIVATVEQRRRRVTAVVRMSADVMPMLRQQFGDDLSGSKRVQADRFEVQIAAASAEMLADKLAGWGQHVDVVAPDEVRASLARIGAELVARYGSRPE